MTILPFLKGTVKLSANKNKKTNLFVSRHDELLAEEADGGICPRGEDPRLRGVELHIKNTEVVRDHVTPEDLDWDDERVLQQVTEGRGQCLSGVNGLNECVVLNGVHEGALLVNCSMADDNGAVVRS